MSRASTTGRSGTRSIMSGWRRRGAARGRAWAPAVSEAVGATARFADVWQAAGSPSDVRATLLLAGIMALASTGPALGDPGVPAASLTISAEARPDGLELRLDGAAPMPAAVFQRGGVLWVLCGGGPGEIAGWPGLAGPELAAWLQPLAAERMAATQVLRFALPRPEPDGGFACGRRTRLGLRPSRTTRFRARSSAARWRLRPTAGCSTSSIPHRAAGWASCSPPRAACGRR